MVGVWYPGSTAGAEVSFIRKPRKFDFFLSHQFYFFKRGFWNKNLTTRTWYTGLNDYRKLTMVVDEGYPNTFTMEIQDVDTDCFSTVQQAYAEHFRNATLPVEVLYSGGLDSESTIVGCLQNTIPVIAVSMRLIFNGSPINTHDLYYAEKFCRERNVRQVFFDLNINQFFENGDHVKYMKPYNIAIHNAATAMWLIEKCHSFPVIGGDYTWPQIGNKVYSPHRHDFCFYDIFMREKGITGIGNMISHSLESNMFFIKEHLNIHQQEQVEVSGDTFKIGIFKNKMLENLGFGKLEMRHRSDGWDWIRTSQMWRETIQPMINKSLFNNKLFNFKPTASKIIWNRKLGELIGTDCGTNHSDGTKSPI
jgi:hypothetical protein